MPTILDLANLADNVYDNAPTAPQGWKRQNSRAPLGGITGFFGASYVSTDGKSMVIAFRGSEGVGTDFVRDWMINDVAILSKSLPIAQALEADMFAKTVNGGLAPSAKLYITGHSLGGALAQIVAGNMAGSVGVTFNAPGVRDHEFVFKRSWSNAASVLNLRVDSDPVSAFGKHVGKDPISLGNWSGLWAETTKVYQAHGGKLMLLFSPTAFGAAVIGNFIIDNGKSALLGHLMGSMFSALNNCSAVRDTTPEALLA